MQRSYGLEIPETLEEVCRPQRLALLVYDMQVGIVRHVPNTQTFVARVPRVIDPVRQQQPPATPRFYKQHAGHPYGRTALQQELAAVAQAPRGHRNHTLYQASACIAWPAAASWIVTRSTAACSQQRKHPGCSPRNPPRPAGPSPPRRRIRFCVECRVTRRGSGLVIEELCSPAAGAWGGQGVRRFPL
jgi:hypothetical protein